MLEASVISLTPVLDLIIFRHCDRWIVYIKNRFDDYCCHIKKKRQKLRLFIEN